MGEITEPIPLAEIMAKYSDKLSPYELEEIKQFDEIFYVGQNAKSKVMAPTKGANNGYDSAEGEYQIVPGDHIAYRYEIIDELGSGAFGQVIKALDHYDHSIVAIKLIRNRRKVALQAREEIKILRFISDEDPDKRFGIVAMFESFTFRGHVCIVYELLGASLYDQMKAHDFYPMRISVIRQIAARMLVSMTFLWKKNIVHCDLKPENILMRDAESTQVKVVDLGSACFDDNNPCMYIQSRFYRAPEIIVGAKYGKPIDLWSFACILCELATGWPIFPGEDEDDQFFAIVEFLGEPPEEFMEGARYRSRFYEKDGTLKKWVSKKRGKERIPGSKTVASFLALPEDDEFVSFVSLFLKWDPSERTIPRAAMSHPFVSEEFVFDKPKKSERKKSAENETGAFRRNPNANAERRDMGITRPTAPMRGEEAEPQPPEEATSPNHQEAQAHLPRVANVKPSSANPVAKSVPSLSTHGEPKVQPKRAQSTEESTKQPVPPPATTAPKVKPNPPSTSTAVASKAPHPPAGTVPVKTTGVKAVQGRDRSLSLHPLNQQKSGKAPALLPQIIPSMHLEGNLEYSQIKDENEKSTGNSNPNKTAENSVRDSANTLKRKSNDNTAEKLPVPPPVDAKLKENGTFNNKTQKSNPTNPFVHRPTAQPPNTSNGNSNANPGTTNSSTDTLKPMYSMLATTDDDGRSTVTTKARTPDKTPNLSRAPTAQRIIPDENSSASEDIIIKSSRPNRAAVGRRQKQSIPVVVPENKEGRLPQ